MGFCLLLAFMFSARIYYVECRLKCIFFLKVDAAVFILENSCPVFSEIGSVKHRMETNIINVFQDYL